MISIRGFSDLTAHWSRLQTETSGQRYIYIVTACELVLPGSPVMWDGIHLDF